MLSWLIIIGLAIITLIDCIRHDIKSKAFWALIIILIPIVGPIVYLGNRSRLLGYPEAGNPEYPPTTRTGKILRTVAISIGVIFMVGGLLLVGFIIILANAFSSMGNSK